VLSIFIPFRAHPFVLHCRRDHLKAVWVILEGLSSRTRFPTHLFEPTQPYQLQIAGKRHTAVGHPARGATLALNCIGYGAA
jgi:hypothetical protein